MTQEQEQVFSAILAQLRTSQVPWTWAHVRGLHLAQALTEPTVQGVWDGYDNAIAEIEYMRDKMREAGGDE